MLIYDFPLIILLNLPRLFLPQQYIVALLTIAVTNVSIFCFTTGALL